MSSHAGLRVVIAGGSLSGLTAAALLRDLGCTVSLHERSASHLEGRGAGIVVHPMTVKYLEGAGGFRPEELSTRVSRLLYLGPQGETVHQEPCIWSFTSWNTLYRSLRRCVDDSLYHLGEQVIGVERQAKGARVRFQDGRQVECDLFIAADGISSTVRSLLLPQTRPHYAGYVAWRGIVLESELDPEAAEILGDAVVYHLMSESHILTYPIPSTEGSTGRGHRPINFVWYRNVPEGDALDDLMTDSRGVRHQVSMPPGAVRDVHLNAMREAASHLPPVLARLVARAEQPFVQPIIDILVPHMAFGRVCLIGDAAFVARPHAAAGTAKAADDAWALADALREEGDLDTAIGRWEARQLGVGSRLVQRVMRTGDLSQFGGGWDARDPSIRFGLYAPGD